MANFTTQWPLFVVPLGDEPEERRKIEFLCALLSKSGVEKILSECIHEGGKGGRPRYDPSLMFLLTCMGFSVDCGRLRDLESHCRFDQRFIFASGGFRPDHTTFCNFINDFVVDRADEIFACVMKAMAEEIGIPLHGDLYIDGSKFEADANKYKFVWKPTAKMEKLFRKCISEAESAGIDCGILAGKEGGSAQPFSASVAALCGAAAKAVADGGGNPSSLRRGKGIRHTKPEKAFLRLNGWLSKMLEYEEQCRICGPGRNSYYKTDHDATAMCLKEDYYSGAGSNMHAAYNVQYGTMKGFIFVVYVSQDRSDYRAFPNTIEKFRKAFSTYPENVTADAGYGGASSYAYLKEKGIGNYVKTSSWEGEISGKRPALFSVDDAGNLICLGGRKASPMDQAPRHPRAKGNSFFTVSGCTACPYMAYCRRMLTAKEADSRCFEVNTAFQKEKQDAFARLLSPKGIEFRVNRSIQAEGSFGIMKQDMRYDRARRTTIRKFNAEMTLTALGQNIRKYLRWKTTGKLPEFWTAPEGLQPERPRKISRTVARGGMKKPKEQPNEKARKEAGRKR